MLLNDALKKGALMILFINAGADTEAVLKKAEMEIDAYLADELFLELKDEEWPFEYTDHDRDVVRAVVFDDEGWFYFVHADRDDEFGRSGKAPLVLEAFGLTPEVMAEKAKAAIALKK